MAEEGKKAGDGGNGGEHTKKVEELFEKHNEGMAAVLNAMKQLNTNMETMGTGLAALNEKVESVGQKSKGSTDDDDDGDVSLEHMSNTELVQHMLKQTTKQFGEMLQPVKEMLENTSNTSNKTAAAVEVREVAAEHKDFWKWQEEMKAIAQEHPNLSIKRIYNLARSENPEKAAKVDEELKAEENKGKEGDQGDKGKGGFGGFTPTSGRSQALDAGKEGNLDANKAAQSAWDKVVPSGSPLATLDEGTPMDTQE